MQEEYYNLPMIRENFISRNIKKVFQGFFSTKKRKRRRKRKDILAQRELMNNNLSEMVEVTGNHRKIDIYEFQEMYKKGEIPIENMNEDQKYALIKLFEMQNEMLKTSISEHQKNAEIYNAEIENLKKELEIIR